MLKSELEKYSSQREYYQLLLTIYGHIGNDIYPILEKAENEKKKLAVKNDPDEITVEDIILV
ncbi:MAG TPA: hypothetical protein PKE30_18715 [Niabella sp.]|nr:hypothetical protein [Niabella sp.]